MQKRNGRRDLAKERRWRELVTKHGASGLSVREFCANAGVVENSFYAWRRELTLRDAEAVTEPGEEKQPPPQATNKRRQRKSLTSATSSSQTTFVPVMLSTLPSASAVEVALPSGVTLRIQSGCDEATLRTVLCALEVH